jgi:DNA-binding LytR/AlgR family response regulator
MNKIRCLVIDDEPLACKGMAEYIGEVDTLRLLATVQNPADAISYLPQTDVLYLDINMPKISGIDFLKQIKTAPLTIITTAYPQYALQGYELDVVDYLLKPVSFARFLKATTKAVDYFHMLHSEKKTPSTPEADYFFVKSHGILEKISLPEIIAVKSLSNYVTIHCGEKKIIAYLTLKQIREHLPAASFIQVHKSFLVPVDKIDRIDREEIVVEKMHIPIGENFREAISRRMEGKILKR